MLQAAASWALSKDLPVQATQIIEKIQFNYSLKNIPIPSRRIYLQSLLDKLDSFIKCLRWKTFFFDTDNQNKENNKPTYGFKTEATPLNTRAWKISNTTSTKWSGVYNLNLLKINSN